MQVLKGCTTPCGFARGRIRPSLRTTRESIRIFQRAGLKVGTCVEPVGPEHTNEEIAEMILYTGSFVPLTAAPGPHFHPRYDHGEERDDHRVAHGPDRRRHASCLPRTVLGNCTTNPARWGQCRGQSVLAEVGPIHGIRRKNRNGKRTYRSRCRSLFYESGLGVLDGPSRFYGA